MPVASKRLISRALKILALVINLVIVVYLLTAKRLFRLRGGGKAERAQKASDTGWQATSAQHPGPWLFLRRQRQLTEEAAPDQAHAKGPAKADRHESSA